MIKNTGRKTEQYKTMPIYNMCFKKARLGIIPQVKYEKVIESSEESSDSVESIAIYHKVFLLEGVTNPKHMNKACHIQSTKRQDSNFTRERDH